MRSNLVAVVFALLIVPGLVHAQSGGVSADGWETRLDGAGADVNDLSFMTMGDGFHVVTGPHAIFWNSENVASGTYTVQATFIQTQPSSHPNSFGLFIGGRDLEGADQRYTYFLIREDGQFLMKKRVGDDTPNLAGGWARHEAVNALEGGRMTNTLSVEVGDEMIRFLSNGTELGSVSRDGLDVDGIAGVRFSHDLNVHVSGFTVE